MNGRDLPIRPAARILLLDDADNLLLFRYRDDAFADSGRPDLFEYWLSPGGGQEGGETLVQTAERELAEECGLTGLTFSHEIAVRCIALRVYGGPEMLCEEHFFLARIAGLKPAIDISGQFQNELDVLREVRWWAHDEMAASEHPIVPTGLPGFLPRILAGDLPSMPVLLEG
jgi:ADP-ribose pyrophosphatase YjhB (NUDIX family)